MAKQNKKTLKGYFETGDVPNQTQYQHLIDSQLNLAETGTQILVGTLSSSFLEVENHITASGNISASGNIITTNITSSGNISASGTIIANKIESDQLFSRVGDANTGIQLASDTVVIEGNDVIIAKFNTSKIALNLPITASGNISSSGTVTAANMTTVGRLYFEGFGGSNIHFTKAGNNLALANGGFTTSEITASGNISSSGNVLANNATIVEQLDMTSATNAKFNMYQESSLNTSFQSRGNINSFIEAGNSTANLGVGTSTPAEKLTVHGNISGSGNLKVDGSQVDFTNLPTSDPNIAGRLFRDGTDLKISVG